MKVLFALVISILAFSALAAELDRDLLKAIGNDRPRWIAHYGKYCGSWRSDRKELHFGGGCFNPVENDVNIEGDETLLNAIKNYKNRK